jgi:hypothetical protein
MTISLAQSLNKTILVAIPSLFGDEKSRPFTLVGIEPLGMGLWLESEALAEKLRSTDKTQHSMPSLTAFFPICQILCVVDPAQFAILARSPAGTVLPIEESQQSARMAKDVERRARDTKPRSKHKSSKKGR